LPKDVIIADWHYAAKEPQAYKSEKLWTDEGFETVGAGWFNPNNIRNLAKACALAGAKGYLQTTWAGFNFKIDGNEHAWYQYWVYILAAEHAWSGENTPEEELPFQAEEVFLDLWSERKPRNNKQSEFFVDLSPLANRHLADDSQRTGWLGFGADFDFSSFPAGEPLRAQTTFLVTQSDQEQAAILLSGKLNPEGHFPDSVKMEIRPRRASALHFLMNTAFSTRDGREVGEIAVEYTDGTCSRMKLLYGKNIFSLTDRRIGIDTRVAWEGQTKSGQTVRAWDVLWRNPTPEKKIASIAFRSAGTEATPILMAVTGTQDS